MPPIVSGARKAMDYLQTARSYPEADIASRGWSAAHQALQRTQQAKSGVSDDQWIQIGPNNIGGRTLALTINPLRPETVYAGSASGGLWRSYTGGAGDNAWSYVPTGFPVLGVAAIAIHPRDTNTIYIGTGEVYGSPESFPGFIRRTTRGSYGIGVLKTTDGGQTWQPCLDWRFDQRRGVQKIRINPQRPESVWAATSEGAFLSHNGGLTWRLVQDFPMTTDIRINPQDTNLVFLATGGMGSVGHGIYRTRDAGEHWERMDLGPDGPTQFFGKAVLSISKSNPDIVMASIGNNDGTSARAERTWLCRTEDGGDNWEVVSTLDYSIFQGWYAHTVAIHPTNPDTVWTAGVSFYPFVSFNKGQNLQSTEDLDWFERATGQQGREYPHINRWADHHDIVFHPTDPQTIYFINDGGVFRTINGGRTTENCNSGYQTTQFYNGFANAAADTALAVGGLQDNNSVLYTGAPEWTRVGAGDGGWAAIHQNEIIVSAQGLYLMRLTRQNNQRLTVITPPNRVAPNFIAPLVASPVNGQLLYGGASFLHVSPDFGRSWTRLPVDGRPIACMAASHQNAGTLYLATTPGNDEQATVYHTDDGGLTTENISLFQLPDRYPTDLAVDPTDDNRLFITFGGFGGAHVFKTEDRGATWIDISEGLPDLPAWSVAVDPEFPAHIYAGNDIGIYLSRDGGLSWAPFIDGLPDAVIAMDLKVSALNRKLRVATHGAGVWERPLAEPSAVAVRAAPPAVELQVYPNPFWDQVNVSFELARAMPVKIAILHTSGQLVQEVVDERRPAGRQTISWQHPALPSGIYLLQMRTGNKVITRKIVLKK